MIVKKSRFKKTFSKQRQKKKNYFDKITNFVDVVIILEIEITKKKVMILNDCKCNEFCEKLDMTTNV